MNSEVLQIAKMIDHSLLHPTLDDQQLAAGCDLARKYRVASVCIKPYAVRQACRLLEGSNVMVGTVIGFPQGSSTTNIKVKETQQACEDGASEIDMVVNIGKVIGQDWDFVTVEIDEVLQVCRRHNAALKVIFENDFLPSDNLKIHLCEICSDLRVDFVKTSTGYGMVKGSDGRYNYQGATVSDLILMRMHTHPDVQIKAAGGVRTLDDLLNVRALGVTRIGATATAAIVDAAATKYGSDALGMIDQTPGY